MDPIGVMKGFENFWQQWAVVENWRRMHQTVHNVTSEKGTHFTHSLQASAIEACNESYTGPPTYNDSCYTHVNNHYVEGESIEEMEHDEMSNDRRNCDESDSSSDCELTFEVNDEMMEFFEQSMRHKMEMRRLKELNEGADIVKMEEDITTEKNSKNKNKKGDNHENVPFKIPVPNISVNEQKRMEEMSLLYGEAAPKICGMETAVQLSFERLCDVRKPVYWPCIPFVP